MRILPAMIEIDDIKDRASLQARLKTLPQKVEEDRTKARRIAVSLAWRAAARVSPLYWRWTNVSTKARHLDLTVLSILRTILTSSVTAVCPTEKNKEKATAARAAALAANTYDPFSFSPAVFAAEAAALAALATIADDAEAAALAALSEAAEAAALATNPDEAADKRFWSCLRIDAVGLLQGKSLDAVPLWHGAGDEFDAWETLKKQVSDPVNGAGVVSVWSFWIWWYEGVLNGTAPAPDSPMMQGIVLLPEEIWQDVDSANARITEIWLDYLAELAIEENPLGHRVVLSKASGKLSVDACEVENLDQVVQDLRRALREFVSACKKDKSNYTTALNTAFSPYVVELRGRVSKHKSDPRELLRAIEEAHRAFGLTANKEGAQDHVLADRLLTNLKDRASDICALAPDVLAEVKKRQSAKMQLLTEQQISLAVRLSAGMAADSEGVLQAAMARSLLVVVSETASDEEKASAWTYLQGALPRGASLKRKASEDGVDGSKDKSVLETVVSYADGAVKVDKGIDAVQEAVSEGGPWVVDTYTQIMSGNLWGVF